MTHLSQTTSSTPSRELSAVPSHKTPNDDGVALPMVIGTAAVIFALLAVSTTALMKAMPTASKDFHNKRAAAAARQGVYHYLTKLSDSGGTYGVDGAGDPGNPAFDTDLTTPSCDGPGQKVDSTPDAATFCYRVDVTASPVLTVTGRSGTGDRQGQRRLSVELQSSSAIDNAAFSNFQVQAPALFDNYKPEDNEFCARYAYGDNARVDSKRCVPTVWGDNDVVRGPFRTNDRLYFSHRPFFEGDPSGRSPGSGFLTAAPPLANGELYEDRLPLKPGDWPILAGRRGAPRAGSAELQQATAGIVPNDNDHLQKYVLPKIDSDPNTNRPGCLYRGLTKITLLGDRVQVLSPNTTDVAPGCPVPNGTAAAAPPIIYVAPAPGNTCQGITGYPRPAEWRRHHEIANPQVTDYNGCRGTALVAGSATQSITVGTSEDIVITDDLTVPNRETSDAVIGLSAGAFTWVHNPHFHPLVPLVGGYRMRLTEKRVSRIDAAIVCARGSFVVQNYRRGLIGDVITVNGSIVGKYASSFGYQTNAQIFPRGARRNFNYDWRLRKRQPPFLIDNADRAWTIGQVIDLPSQG